MSEQSHKYYFTSKKNSAGTSLRATDTETELALT